MWEAINPWLAGGVGAIYLLTIQMKVSTTFLKNNANEKQQNEGQGETTNEREHRANINTKTVLYKHSKKGIQKHLAE